MKNTMLILMAAISCNAADVTVRNLSGAPIKVGDYYVNGEHVFDITPGTIAIERTNRIETIEVPGEGTVSVGAENSVYSAAGVLSPFWLGMSLGGVVYGFALGRRVISHGMAEKISAE